MAVIKPRIAYDNYLQDSATTITFSTETVGFEAALAYNNRSDQGWLPSAVGLSTITADLGSSRTVNAFCIGRSTLGTNDGTIELFYSDTGTGGPWTSFATAISPVDERQFYTFNDAGEDHQYWQVQMTSAVASELNLLFVGSDFEIAEGQYAGTTPPFLNRADNIQVNQTQGATFVGAAILSENTKVNFKYEHLSQSFVRTIWEPFQLHGRTKPYWLLWNSEGKPDEATWAFPSGAFPNSSNDTNGFMAVGLKSNALPSIATLTQ